MREIFRPIIPSEDPYSFLKAKGFLDEQGLEELRAFSGTGRSPVLQHNLFLYRDTSVFENLALLVPQHQRVVFLVDQNFPRVLRELVKLEKDSDEECDFTIDELRPLANHNRSATLITSYLQFSRDAEFVAWFSNEDTGRDVKSRLRQFILVNDDFLATLQYLMIHPNREDIYNHLTPYQLKRALSAAPINYSHLHLDDLIADPDAISAISQTPKDLDWSKRIVNLIKYLHSKDLAGYSDWDINTEFVKSHLAKYPDSGSFIKQKLKTDPHSEFSLISSIRNFQFIDNYIEARHNLKNAGKYRDSAKDLDLWDARLERAQIDIKENPNNALSHLIPTCGYEIEYRRNDAISYRTHSIVERLGFKEGIGGGDGYSESSPGPFRHPDTANLVFLAFVKYGLIDMYREYGQSVHFNLGLVTNEDTAIFARLMQATAYAYAPVFSPESYSFGSRHLVRVGADKKGYGNYYEFKDFSLQTVRGFLTHMKQGVYLGTALNAYQQYRKEQANSIKESSLTSDSKRLAYIWQDIRDGVPEAYETVGVADVLRSECKMEYAKYFAKQITAVFPDQQSRYHIHPRDVETPNTVHWRGLTFPNIVDFSREITTHASDAIENVLKESQTTAVNQLKNIKGTNDKFNRDTKMRVFFNRFPCGITDYANKEARYERMIELFKLYSVV